MVFQIKLADQIIEIHSLCNMVFKLSQKYIVSPDQYTSPDITVNICDQDIIKEFNELRYAYINNGLTPPVIGEGYCESLAVFRKIADAMPAFDTFLIHGAAISKDNQAYIFTADSGVGKTTRAKLWLEQYPDSFIINGDKPLIKVTEKDIHVCGTPWSGKEGWNTNIMVPLKAIYMLERAENQPDHIEEIDIENALPYLLRQIHRPPKTEDTLKTIQLISSLGNRVKFYRFRSDRTHESIKLAYRTANMQSNT